MSEVRETLSGDKMQEILQIGKVDAGNGMLFGTAQAHRRLPKKTGLTLVIGTGGSGTTAIREAIRIADQKLTEEYRNYVEFIVVDSAKQELEEVKRQPGVTTLNISTPGADKRMILKPGEERRPPFFREFMPADYDIQKIKEDGASRDRITGKMKLYDISGDRASTNDARFQEMIRHLFEGKWSSYKNLPVDVMILTGTGGGNGSGTFIDLAARAKRACQEAEVESINVYGYIMLPDTAEKFTNKSDVRQAFYRNGFAALKELESYMSIGFNQEREESIRSTNAVEDIKLTQTNLPFDYPVLISGDYNEAVSMIAETIVNLLGENGGNFSQNSFYCNITDSRLVGMSSTNMCANGILKIDACPEDSHMYCGIGYAHASIPEKIVIPNVVSKVCGSLFVSGKRAGINAEERSAAFCSRKRHLSKVEFEEQIATLFSVDSSMAVSGSCLWNLICGKLDDLSCLPENPNNDSLTYDDIATHRTGTWASGFQAISVSRNAKTEIVKYLDDLYQSFCSKAVTVMKKYGPRAIEYLYSGEGEQTAHDFSDISVKRILQTAGDNITELALTGGNHPEALPAKGWLGERIATHIKGEVSRWIQEETLAVQDDVCTEIAQSMDGANGSWKKNYVDKVENFINCCIRFANVLEQMTTYYSSAGRSLDANTFSEFAQNNMEKNGLNLCSNQSMFDWVKDSIADKVSSIDTEAVKEKLVNDFMEHSSEWCSQDVGRARARYDEVMSICCQLGANAPIGNGLNLTIKDYFDVALEGIPVASQNAQINNIVSDIMQRLKQKSMPSLRVRPNSFYDINVNVLIPQSLIRGQYGEQILASFNQNLGKKADDNNGVSVSPIVESIVCYQTSVAHALSSLADLSKWEQAYETLGTSSMHLNNGEYESKYTEMRMSEKDRREEISRKNKVSEKDDRLGSVGLSWKNYPSVNIIAYQNQFTKFDSLVAQNTEARYRRDVFNEKIEYALAEKIIECVETGTNQYAYFINLIPEDWNNFRLNAYTEREKGKYKRGETLFQFLRKQNDHSNAEFRKEIKLIGSDFFEKPFDFNEIIRVQHWNKKRVTQEHQAYMKRIMRKNTALYLELEDTLRRYYDIRRALEENEKGYRAYIFCELYLYDCIIADETEEQWDVRVNLDGGIRDIVTLDWLTKATGLDMIEDRLYDDGMILPIVYNRFKTMDLNMEELEQIRIGYVRLMGQQQPQEFRTVVAERAQRLLKGFEVYKNAFGSKTDPGAEIIKKYQLSADEADAVQELMIFYESLLEVLTKNKKVIGRQQV